MNKNKKIIVPFSFIVDKCNVTVTRFTHDVYSLGLIVSITVDKYAMYVLFSACRLEYRCSCFTVFRLLLSSGFIGVIFRCHQLNAFKCDSSDDTRVRSFHWSIDQIARNTKITTRSHYRMLVFVCSEKKEWINEVQVHTIIKVMKKLKCENWKKCK